MSTDFEREVNAFLALVNRFIEKTGHVYRTYPESPFSYTPFAVHEVRRSETQINFGFTYWDGADALQPDLGDLFRTETDRAEIAALACQAFSRPVRFTEDFNAILI